MKNEITIEIPGIPKPSGSKRAFIVKGKPVVVDANSLAREWKNAVRQAAITSISGMDGFPSMGPVAIECAFYLPRPKSHFDAKGNVRPRFANAAYAKKPDLSKLCRAVEDAMIGICYHDDAQIVQLQAAKHYCLPPESRAVITVSMYEERIESSRNRIRSGMG